MPIDQPTSPFTPKGRRRLRPGSILLTAVMVLIAATPFVILLLMPSCTGVPPHRESTKTKDRLNFENIPKVRVALARRTHGGVTMTIRVNGPYTLMDLSATPTVLERGPRLDRSPVRSLSSGLVVVVPDRSGIKQTLYLKRIRIAPTKSGTLKVGNRYYRGVLDIVYNSDGTMTLINELDIEAYLGGVVPAEMPYNWPKQALRAQAVASRTYALALLMENDRSRSRPEWDVTADYITAQAYKGKTEERPSVLEAVRATRGTVLTYQGKVFRTYFHSCCGGHTEACGLVWDDYDTIEPLTGTVCGHCKRSKWFNWTQTLTFAEMEAALRRAGRDVGAVHDVAFVDGNADGHADRVTVKGSRRTLEMSGNDFRLAVGSTRLKSMMFESERTDEGYVFTGHGFGHGVGMCQYGARGMAATLHNYERILKRYYPDTELWKVY